MTEKGTKVSKVLDNTEKKKLRGCLKVKSFRKTKKLEKLNSRVNYLLFDS